MSKNNSLRNMTKENKNYKLYKAKKQWITACATFMFMFGATAVVNTEVHAATTDNDAEPTVAEETSDAANTGSASNKVVLKTATPASAASEAPAQGSTAPAAAKDGSSAANSASIASSSQASATPSSDSTAQASFTVTSAAPAKKRCEEHGKRST